jgi:hypothetical protein
MTLKEKRIPRIRDSSHAVGLILRPNIISRKSSFWRVEDNARVCGISVQPALALFRCEPFVGPGFLFEVE